MSVFKPLRGKPLNNDELLSLAAVCGCVVVLIAAAVFFSMLSHTPAPGQAAATALGDVQGIPAGYTGKTYPDYTSCLQDNALPTHGSGGWGPLCLGNAANPFYSEIFSVSPTGSSTGESVYAKSSYADQHYQQGPYVGPSTYNNVDCTTYNYKLPAGYSAANGDYIDGRYDWSIGNGDGAVEYPNCYAYHEGKRSNNNPGTYIGPGYQPNTNNGGGGADLIGAWGNNINPTADCKMYTLPAGYSIANGDIIGGSGYQISTSDADPQWIDGGCYAYKNISAAVTSSLVTAGAAPAVNPGGSITLQWSCLPSRQAQLLDYGGESLFTNGHWALSPLYNITLNTGIAGRGPGFSPSSSAADSKTITAPTTPGIYTYSLTCQGAWNLPTMNVPVNVGDVTLTQPTATIDAGGGPGVTQTVAVNTPVTITATFKPGAGDTLALTAIDGPNSTNSVSGVPWTPPTSPKTYTFRPTAAGSYIFYPSLQSLLFPTWNNYNAAVTVIATTGTTTQQSCPLAHEVGTPPNCQCDTLSGYTMQNGSCQLTTQCADPHEAPPSCLCVSPYTKVNGVCTDVPKLSLSVAQARVDKGTPASLSWSVGNLGDPGIQCAISSSPSGVFSQTMPSGIGSSWSGSSATGPIEGTTVFTLSCNNAASVSVTVTLIPQYIEN